MGIRTDVKRLQNKVYHIYCKALRKATRTDHSDYMMSHRVIGPTPQVPYSVTEDIAPSKDDFVIAERLLSAYKKAVDAEKGADNKPVEDVWTELQTKVNFDFLQLLKKDDPEELATYLCNMSRHSATHGINQGHLEYDRIVNDKKYARSLSLVTKDKLVSLAEAVGALPVENPEQGHYGENIYVRIEELVDKIEATMGIELSPPP